jgi:hypothetical protein
MRNYLTTENCPWNAILTLVIDAYHCPLGVPTSNNFT